MGWDAWMACGDPRAAGRGRAEQSSRSGGVDGWCGVGRAGA